MSNASYAGFWVPTPVRWQVIPFGILPPITIPQGSQYFITDIELYYSPNPMAPQDCWFFVVIDGVDFAVFRADPTTNYNVKRKFRTPLLVDASAGPRILRAECQNTIVDGTIASGMMSGQLYQVGSYVPSIIVQRYGNAVITAFWEPVPATAYTVPARHTLYVTDIDFCCTGAPDEVGVLLGNMAFPFFDMFYFAGSQQRTYDSVLRTPVTIAEGTTFRLYANDWNGAAVGQTFHASWRGQLKQTR